MRSSLRIATFIFPVAIILGCQGTATSDGTHTSFADRIALHSLTTDEISAMLEDCPTNPDGTTECLIICHIPPGKPEKMKTLAIPESALDAHLNHPLPKDSTTTDTGDFLGSCDQPTDDGGYSSEEPTDDGTPSDDPSYCDPVSLYDLDCDGYNDLTGEPI